MGITTIEWSMILHIRHKTLLVFSEHPLVSVHALLNFAADVGDESVDGHPQEEEAVLDRHEEQDPVTLAGGGGEGLEWGHTDVIAITTWCPMSS